MIPRYLVCVETCDYAYAIDVTDEMSYDLIRACARSVNGAEKGADRAGRTRLERSGAVSGVQKNQVERERRSSGRERSGERAKSAAQNPLHHKTTQSKKFEIEFKSYHKTVSVSSLLLSLLCRE